MKVLLLIVLVVIFVTLVFNSRQSNFDSIPKIIHQTAPADESKWPHVWKTSQKTWKKHFPDFEYIMWTDEDLDSFIETEYPWFYDTYMSYDVNIKRIDAARYFILYHYGGMYADMDMSCKDNFWHEIPQNKVSIAENPWNWKPGVQNALMISPKEHPSWQKVWSELENHKNEENVLDATGPKLIDGVVKQYPNMFNILKRGDFIQTNSITQNPVIRLDDDEDVYVEHHASASWGSGPLNELYKSIKS
jgi:mannosyltransferase OCH1-like enzyme